MDSEGWSKYNYLDQIYIYNFLIIDVGVNTKYYLYFVSFVTKNILIKKYF